MMSTIHLIHHSEDLVQALNSYKKLLGWQHDFKVPQKGELPALDLHDFFVVYNKDPEKLDGLRAAQHLRSHPDTFGMPILFLSDKLSDYAQLIYDDLDFVWFCEQPFQSRQLIFHLSPLNAQARGFRAVQLSLHQILGFDQPTQLLSFSINFFAQGLDNLRKITEKPIPSRLVISKVGHLSRLLFLLLRQTAPA